MPAIGIVKAGWAVPAVWSGMDPPIPKWTLEDVAALERWRRALGFAALEDALLAVAPPSPPQRLTDGAAAPIPPSSLAAWVAHSQAWAEV
jgi:hypothetical protein